LRSEESKRVLKVKNKNPDTISCIGIVLDVGNEGATKILRFEHSKGLPDG